MWQISFSAPSVETAEHIVEKLYPFLDSNDVIYNNRRRVNVITQDLYRACEVWFNIFPNDDLTVWRKQ